MNGFDMQCDKVQRLFDDLSEGRIPEALSRELHRHLEECTDCRVAQQRAARLQQLLSLKRHEQPSPEYFDSFLAGFHARLQAQAEVQDGWWERFSANFTLEGWRTWHYAVVAGVGVFLVVGVLVSKEMVSVGRSVVASQISNPTREVFLTLPDSVHPISAGSPAIAPVEMREEVSAPRYYVLDRYTVTPATYDVADVHF